MQRSNFDKILRFPGSFNLRPVHMILGVSQRKSYVYFDIQFFFFNFIDIAVCTKVTARLNKKTGAIQHIS